MKHLFCIQLFLAISSLGSDAAVRIIEPYPVNVFGVPGTRHVSTCIATDDDKPPALVKFAIRDQYSKYSDIVNSERLYQTNVTKGNTVYTTIHFANFSAIDVKVYECLAFSNSSNANPDSKRQLLVQLVPHAQLPKMSYTAGSMNATRGGTATLNCSVVDIGKRQFKISMRWLKDGKEIASAPMKEFRPLVLKNVRASNGGEYRCELRAQLDNYFDYNITGGPINVNVPVYMAKGDQEIGVMEGHNVTLECSAEGYPLNIVWKKVVRGNETDIATISSLSQRVKFRHECPYCHYMMDIFNVTEAFGGKYICRTVNSLGSGQQQFTLIVNGGKVKIVEPFPPTIFPIEGEAAFVTCIAEGAPDEVKFVRKDEFGGYSKVAESSRVYSTNRTLEGKTFFTLHFTSVKLTPDDSTEGSYECWAHTPGDNTVQWKSSAKMSFNVNVIKKSSLPSVTPGEAVVEQKEVNQSLVMGCNFSIPDVISDVSPVATHWLKNDVTVESVYAVGEKFVKPLKPLQFENIAPRNGGNYTCVLETKLKRSKPYNITGGPFIVQIKVHMSEGDRQIHVDLGGNVTLECSAEGYPLSVVWKKVVEGKEIDIENISGLSEHVRFRHDCPFCRYVVDIFNITEAIEGIYICRTVNGVDSGQQQFTLKVDGVPVSSSVTATTGAVIFFISLLYHLV